MKERHKINLMNKLPTECILNIFIYLESKSLILMLSINKKFNQIIKDNYVHIYSKKHYFNYNNSYDINQLYLRDYYINNFNIIIYFNKNYEIDDNLDMNINYDKLKCLLCGKYNIQIFKHFINDTFYLNVPYCSKYCCINDFNKSIITNYGNNICKWNYINKLFKINDNKCNKKLNCCNK